MLRHGKAKPRLWQLKSLKISPSSSTYLVWIWSLFFYILTFSSAKRLFPCTPILLETRTTDFYHCGGANLFGKFLFLLSLLESWKRALFNSFGGNGQEKFLFSREWTRKKLSDTEDFSFFVVERLTHLIEGQTYHHDFPTATLLQRLSLSTAKLNTATTKQSLTATTN